MGHERPVLRGDSCGVLSETGWTPGWGRGSGLGLWNWKHCVQHMDFLLKKRAKNNKSFINFSKLGGGHDPKRTGTTVLGT